MGAAALGSCTLRQELLHLMDLGFLCVFFDLAWLPVASMTLGSLLTSHLEPQFHQVRWAGQAD